ncbi:GntR family transcriptional regulator [Polycladidibacter hongkongensis]|uniref:GntR family transcriptional regulator n=1 Tax=Polycladidibacter hongkongensis TaxID=1647556 RepID=UPI00082E04C3|nr:GntR family transcriptional regulator [Pseudovibrio hongkongensis]
MSKTGVHTDPHAISKIFARETWGAEGGPLYLQLVGRITTGIHTGALPHGAALPTERDLANMTEVSRVTVRKAIAELVNQGVLVQRQGSGTFVAPKVEQLDQSLASLTSFSQEMAARGKTVSSKWLQRSVTRASSEEALALTLPTAAPVVRLSRLRLADGVPLAHEVSALPVDAVPDPLAIKSSLYDYLKEQDAPPVRAVQRISAIMLSEPIATQLQLPTVQPALHIERIAYLADGRPIERTCSIYRADAYNFVVELDISGKN